MDHVLIDFENVQKLNPPLQLRHSVSVTLLLGPRQRPSETLIESLLEVTGTLKLVRLKSAGRNALDFTLAYYLGREVAMDPTGSFHIISKDKGYDPLIEHLESRKIQARRHDGLHELGAPKAADKSVATPAPKVGPQTKIAPATEDLKQNVDKIVAHLRDHPKNRPSTRKRLLSFVIAHLGNQTNQTAAERTVQSLENAGYVFCDEKGKATYFRESN